MDNKNWRLIGIRKVWKYQLGNQKP